MGSERTDGSRSAPYGKWTNTAAMSSRSVKLYVTLAVLAAVASAVGIAVAWPDKPHIALSTLVVLAAIAASAEKVRIPQANGSYTSFAAWPLTAAIFLSPSWVAVLAAISASVAMQLLARRAPIKATFNVAITALSASLAVAVFRLLGGVAFPALDAVSWIDGAVRTSKIDGVPVVFALVIFYLVQTFAVAGVLALADGKSITSVWKADFRHSFTGALLCIPIVPWFAWQITHSGILIALLPAAVLVGIWTLLVKESELDRTHQDLLTLMVSSIESRDPYTSGHSQRVQKYSIIIGRALGMNVTDLERLGIAALLHDVGKAHPKHTSWLKKPGALTRDELLVMQEHPADGANLVAVAKTLGDIVQPILHHHENWDGSGFPKLLSGTNIPMFSRVIRVADAVDAMTTTRPYKAKKNPEQVLVELEAFCGTWFDPQIIRTLLSSPQWITLRREIDRNEISGPRNFGLTPKPHLRRVGTGSSV
jgi:HD-GYP domain-containing protein (c-di-GMP phosphodiesterase class II)